MKNKKIMKVISVVLIILTIVMATMPVFAVAPDPKAFQGHPSNASASASQVINIVLGIIQVVAVGVAVIMLVVLAIKYISASPEGKADIKKTAVQYVVGAVLLFGASGILQLVKTFATQAFPE